MNTSPQYIIRRVINWVIGFVMTKRAEKKGEAMAKKAQEDAMKQYGIKPDKNKKK